MISPVSLKPQQTKLFCQQYWERILKDAKPLVKSSIEHHESLAEVNATALIRNYNTGLPLNFLKQIMAQSDKEFKLLKPLEKDITLWRGVSMPQHPMEKKYIGIFDKAYNIRKGDIIHMPEYPYASDDKNYASLFASNSKKAILYEIQVPKGAKLSQTWAYVFPRYSRFECLETVENKTEQNTIKLIKLKYILPEI